MQGPLKAGEGGAILHPTPGKAGEGGAFLHTTPGKAAGEGEAYIPSRRPPYADSRDIPFRVKVMVCAMKDCPPL